MCYVRKTVGLVCRLIFFLFAHKKNSQLFAHKKNCLLTISGKKMGFFFGACRLGMGASTKWVCRDFGCLHEPAVCPVSLREHVPVVFGVFGLWRVCFPPCLVRPGRRVPVQGLSEGSRGCGVGTRTLDFGGCAFLPFSLGPQATARVGTRREGSLGFLDRYPRGLWSLESVLSPLSR